jgi:hypothetical protein
MQTIFQEETNAGIVQRIRQLHPDAKPLWGKMSPWQMLRHCNLSEAMYQGKVVHKRLFIGRLFGKMALSGILKNEAAMQQNAPTHPTFKITGSGDFHEEQNRWMEAVQAYLTQPVEDIVHPFFGPMTRPQIGWYVYKHSDHHLRQFGV